MKVKILFLTLLVFSLTIQAQVSEKNLMEKWKLKQVLSDPGDGSGDFEFIKSEKTIGFLANGKVVSNGSLCGPYNQIGKKSEDTYSKENNTITPSGCSKETKLVYELKNDYLIIHYSCKEGCAEKFEKIK
jgi:hypothetical protein